jgi:hypothetical protein
MYVGKKLSPKNDIDKSHWHMAHGIVALYYYVFTRQLYKCHDLHIFSFLCISFIKIHCKRKNYFVEHFFSQSIALEDFQCDLKSATNLNLISFIEL